MLEQREAGGGRLAVALALLTSIVGAVSSAIAQEPLTFQQAFGQSVTECRSNVECGGYGVPAGSYCSADYRCSEPVVECRAFHPWTGGGACRIAGFCPSCGSESFDLASAPATVPPGAALSLSRLESGPTWVPVSKTFRADGTLALQVAFTFGDAQGQAAATTASFEVSTGTMASAPNGGGVLPQGYTVALPAGQATFYWVLPPAAGTPTVTARTSSGAVVTRGLTVDRCTFSVTSPVLAGAQGGTVPLAVFTQPGCAWTLRVPDWLAAGNTRLTDEVWVGPGTLPLTVPAAPNQSVFRTGLLHIADAAIPVEQSSLHNCTPSLQAPIVAGALDWHPDGAYRRLVSLSFGQPGCAWQVSSLTDWIDVEPSTGADQFLLTVDRNPGDSPRSGTIRVGGRDVTVMQDAWRGFRRALAEGVVDSLFDTRVALANPHDTATFALVTFVGAGGTSSTTRVWLPARRRHTLVAGTLGLPREFSMVVEAERPIAAERVVRWAGGGTHAETASHTPTSQWYFAEGATTGAFELFYLLQNPGTVPATVSARFLLGAGAPVARTYVVPPQSRYTVWANQDEALRGVEVSAVFTVVEGPGILAERAMYRRAAGGFEAGHGSSGLPAPSSDAYFAEGATGPFFDLYYLLANPHPTPIVVDARYLQPSGAVITRSYAVAPESRFTIWADADRELADTAMAAEFRARDAATFVAERAMWWPGDATAWYEAHASGPTGLPAARWLVAAAEQGGAERSETYTLVANATGLPGTVRATAFFESDRSPLVREYPIAAYSRLNVTFPEAQEPHSVLIESIGTPGPDLVVERALYSSPGGRQWTRGASSSASPIP